MIKRHIPESVLKDFFHDFHLMLSTGMPLTQALHSLKETTSFLPLRKIIDQVHGYIQQGDSLTQAFRQSQGMPWIVLTIVNASETAGILSEGMGILGQYFTQASLLKSKFKQALFYPMIVMVILIGLMMFVGLYVVPKLRVLLPPEAIDQGATHIVLSVSNFLQDYGFIIFIILLAAIIGFIVWSYKQQQRVIDMVCRIPIVHHLVKEAQLAMYLLNLGVLAKSGVSIFKGIEQLNSIEPTLVSRKFYDSRQFMYGGLSLWEALRQDRFFPLFLIFSIRRGEELGRLDEFCLRLSTHYQQKFNVRLEQMIHLTQPLLLAIGGGLLALIGLSFLMPIYGNLTRIASG